MTGGDPLEIVEGLHFAINTPERLVEFARWRLKGLGVCEAKEVVLEKEVIRRLAQAGLAIEADRIFPRCYRILHDAVTLWPSLFTRRVTYTALPSGEFEWDRIILEVREMMNSVDRADLT